ncbi:DKNYY domain-containing protein [uncultured Dysgonomonas sp.]|uniref:Uncharacterized protein n=1 Tax=uncultured Dysgonomonas sp. TaxID=206096 RepID=A0A212K5L4_9BACT|nr:DKNYY domain-containing protein [uncultured Dysgonomonas sp.]SBW06907.1 exported hypothetical protein [uncultured Dysgonomonas sp.]
MRIKVYYLPLLLLLLMNSNLIAQQRTYYIEDGFLLANLEDNTNIYLIEVTCEDIQSIKDAESAQYVQFSYRYKSVHGASEKYRDIKAELIKEADGRFKIMEKIMDEVKDHVSFAGYFEDTTLYAVKVFDYLQEQIKNDIDEPVSIFQISDKPQVMLGSFMPDFTIGRMGISNTFNKIGYEVISGGVVGTYHSYVEIKDIDYDTIQLAFIGSTVSIEPRNRNLSEIIPLKRDYSIWINKDVIYSQSGVTTAFKEYKHRGSYFFEKEDGLYLYPEMNNKIFPESLKVADIPSTEHIIQNVFADKDGFWHSYHPLINNNVSLVRIIDKVRRPATPLRFYKYGFSYNGKVYLVWHQNTIPIETDLDARNTHIVDGGLGDGIKSWVWNRAMLRFDRVPYFTDMHIANTYSLSDDSTIYINLPPKVNARIYDGPLAIVEGKTMLRTPRGFIPVQVIFYDTESKSTDAFVPSKFKNLNREYYQYGNKLYSVYENKPIDTFPNPSEVRVLQTIRNSYIIDDNRFYTGNYSDRNDVDIKKLGVIVDDSGNPSAYLTDGKKLIYDLYTLDGIDIKSLKMVDSSILVDKNNLYIMGQIIPLKEMFVPISIINKRSIRIKR